MPGAPSQVDLIRQTYARAGLDCTNPSDRCQYFEAHGTGTPYVETFSAIFFFIGLWVETLSSDQRTPKTMSYANFNFRNVPTGHAN